MCITRFCSAIMRSNPHLTTFRLMRLFLTVPSFCKTSPLFFHALIFEKNTTSSVAYSSCSASSPLQNNFFVNSSNETIPPLRPTISAAISISGAILCCCCGTEAFSSTEISICRTLSLVKPPTKRPVSSNVMGAVPDIPFRSINACAVFFEPERSPIHSLSHLEGLFKSMSRFSIPGEFGLMDISSPDRQGAERSSDNSKSGFSLDKPSAKSWMPSLIPIISLTVFKPQFRQSNNCFLESRMKCSSSKTFNFSRIFFDLALRAPFTAWKTSSGALEKFTGIFLSGLSKGTSSLLGIYFNFKCSISYIVLRPHPFISLKSFRLIRIRSSVFFTPNFFSMRLALKDKALSGN